MLELSPKTQAYIHKVEKKTGRKVWIEEVPAFSIGGMGAAHVFHPNLIHVQVLSGISTADADQSVPHEVTHGFLRYGRGYCQPKKKAPLSNRDTQILGFLTSMLEDIAVNKILQDEGFEPYAHHYLDEVKLETTRAKTGVDAYSGVSPDPLVKNCFRVWRYIMAWAFLEFYGMKPYHIPYKVLTRFLRAASEAYPRQAKQAKQIQNIINQNDIFTASGYAAALRLTLKLYDLADAVELVVD